MGSRKLISVPGMDEALAFSLEDYGEGEPLESVPGELTAALEAFGTGVVGDERVDVDRETRERLSELGYLE